jgi:hypothetical protein
MVAFRFRESSAAFAERKATKRGQFRLSSARMGQKSRSSPSGVNGRWEDHPGPFGHAVPSRRLPPFYARARKRSRDEQQKSEQSALKRVILGIRGRKIAVRINET